MINKILLCVSGNLAKRSWENLRDSYRKKLKARSETKSGQAADNTDTKWPYFESMDFLRDMLIPRESSGNLQFPAYAASSSANQEDINHVLLVDDQFNDSLPSGSVNSPSATTQEEHSIQPVSFDGKRSESENKKVKPLKRKTDIGHQALDLERRKLQLLEERFAEKTRKDDEDYLFLMSLLPSIKILDTLQKMKLRMSMLADVTRELEIKSFRDRDNSLGVNPPQSDSSCSFLTSAPPSAHYSVHSPADSYVSQSVLPQNQTIAVPEQPHNSHSLFNL